MMRPMRFSALLIAALCALSVSAVAVGQDRQHHGGRRDHETARAALAQGAVLPLSRILAIVAERAPGDVIGVELDDRRNRLIYEIKLLNKAGRVISVELDAKTGRVLEIEND